MEEKYSKITLKSNKPIDEGGAFYANVKSLEFSPREWVCDIKPKVKKGEYYYWKLFNLIPLIPFKAKEDLYYYVKNGITRTFTNDIEEYFYEKFPTINHRFVLIGNTVYKKAMVVGICHDKLFSNCRYFDDNKSAMEYLEYTKKRCKFYDNELENC